MTETRRPGYQSTGQDRQITRHRLQSRPEFARQVEIRYQDDQGHRQVTGEQDHDGKGRQENHASQETFQIVNFIFEQQLCH